MNPIEILQGPFDIETHKANFVHYLEVVIAPCGTVHYAVPSHQEFLIQTIMKQKNLTREEVVMACPEELRWDFLRWLCKESGGYLPVWEDFYENENLPLTKEQKNALKKLKKHGLFRGALRFEQEEQ